MKLFSGGVFRRKKHGVLNDDVDYDEDGEGTPAFIEISSVRSGASRGASGSITGSYAPPAVEPVISAFENESDSDSEM